MLEDHFDSLHCWLEDCIYKIEKRCRFWKILFYFYYYIEERKQSDEKHTLLLMGVTKLCRLSSVIFSTSEEAKLLVWDEIINEEILLCYKGENKIIQKLMLVTFYIFISVHICRGGCISLNEIQQFLCYSSWYLKGN